MRHVLADAGALIALLDASDSHHHACVEALKRIREPLGTVWPAAMEAMHLLSGVARAPERLCDMLTDGAVQLLRLDAADVPRMKALMRKYRDQPMDVGDAALVRVAEREDLNRILTFDAHFHIYRLPGRAQFTVLPR